MEDQPTITGNNGEGGGGKKNVLGTESLFGSMLFEERGRILKPISDQSRKERGEICQNEKFWI